MFLFQNGVALGIDCGIHAGLFQELVEDQQIRGTVATILSTAFFACLGVCVYLFSIRGATASVARLYLVEWIAATVQACDNKVEENPLLRRCWRPEAR